MNALFRKFLLVCAICLALSMSAFASDAETMFDTAYCFSEADFCTEDMGAVDGIFVTAVPDSSIATIRLGTRRIMPGDVLSAASLPQLELIPKTNETSDAALCYLPIYGSHVAMHSEVVVRIQSGKNEAPKADNVDFETYKNIANDGKLSASDPENSAMTYQLVDEPKRGTVKLASDGTFVYTPEENKVGEDRFTYTATDDAGNVSTPATVNIRILNPTDKMTFSDMTNNDAHFEALWMKETGLYGGKQLGTRLCFCPDEAVSRADFLVMAMNMLQIKPEEAEPIFSDCKEGWLQGYLTSAMRQGIIRGERTDEGLCFHPQRAISAQEACVIMQNALDLPVSASSAHSAYPAWSAKAVMAMSEAGIEMDFDSEALSLRDCSELFYRISKL